MRSGSWLQGVPLGKMRERRRARACLDVREDGDCSASCGLRGRGMTRAQPLLIVRAGLADVWSLGAALGILLASGDEISGREA
ncbi:hypothetical protein BU26DRAFT_220392 [Trematosphaeria pertusa]|uniref:Uncharacterized protein n=1 Tax=Trematosphaeria pertusa TaxID=390896 RepID=A0A6A6IS38_9PLEO|nr:uncharacterized protein BU26DRAFT_220392 [Trematosphaeria pertusa]KAF2253311.1 hypothetical protein BU26DRAFT_220392 [Trematosphaeria pertusa]